MTDLEKTAESNASNTGSETAGDLLAAGSILADKYKIISLIGKGGMGSVYRVRQIFLEQDLALKVLTRSGNADDVHVRRFQNEGKAAFNLNHPNLVKVHDFGLLEDQSPYLVMDYVSGTTLADFLKQEKGMSVDQAIKIIAQTALGLAYAHQNSVVHRDIKPSNIMLVDGVPLGEEGSVKIVDFGIAKVLNDEGEMQTLTQTGEVFGSPYYMSPEQCSGAAIDHRTDVYSLGCVLFEILTGTPPHVGTNPLRTMMLHQSQAAPSLQNASLGQVFPAALEAIVQKMLEKDPASRYQNLGVVANELADSNKPDNKVLPIATVKQTADKSSNRKLLFAGGVLALGSVAIFSLLNHPDTDSKSVSDTRSKPGVPAEKQEEETSGKYEPVKDVAKNAGVTDYLNSAFTPEKMRKFSDEVRRARPFVPEAVRRGESLQFKIVFPECGIGTITNNVTHHNSHRKIPYFTRQARGLQYLPTHGPYGFEADVTLEPQTFANPSVLKKFGTETLNELSLLYTDPLEDKFALPPPGELQEVSIAQMLNIATTWKNLELVRFGNLRLNETAILQLNHMPALKGMILKNCTMTNEISQQPFLQHLTSLGLGDCEVNPLLKALSKSATLESLSLKNTNFSADALKSLQKCSSLKYVTFNERNLLNDSQFTALLSLKQVREISFGKRAVSEEQVAKLAQCKWLKRIILPVESRVFIKQLPEDPRFFFFDE